MSANTYVTDESRQSAARRVPKICGADAELGNFILGLERPGGTGYEAAKVLLKHIDGVSRSPRGSGESWHYTSSSSGRVVAVPGSSGGYRNTDQDWGRKFLPSNGGCAYIDMNHIELCTPEVRSAIDFTAAWQAMLGITLDSLVRANESMPSKQRIQVLVNNSDGLGNSYGGHLNFMVSRQAWEEIFRLKLHYLLFLASCQVSSIVFTGQGKVGSENGQPSVNYQLSQRADFFETMTGVQTTTRRPIVNRRDESLCGRAACDDDSLARLHCIFYDSNLADEAVFLKVGAMQIILSMIEAGHVDTSLILDEPLSAVISYSHDPTLTATAEMALGGRLTAVELQLRILEQAKRFVESEGCEGRVPDAEKIIDVWEDTLVKLEARDMDALASRLDWVLKLSTLEQAMSRHRKLNWHSPEIKHLDLMYGSLEDGLFWEFRENGIVNRLVSDDQINLFKNEPPSDTRAWTRAMMMRTFPDVIDDVDWDRMRFRVRSSSYWSSSRTLDMPDPGAMGEADAGAVLANSTLGEALDGLGGPASASDGSASYSLDSLSRYPRYGSGD